ncbi:AAA family ATPase [Defluviimonas sp. WL0024]|uniref:AAA family ATPase n=1 Tax=Albidovulum salinarum TaxID=2984153 RepID=A0ABT2X504_9RHOB|nr:AAA family ATPase [Defluviimonas sp. WL0024]MCU9849017.1 AAA family ATPase [Defluviimonas sp. WL0024]
MPRIPFIAARFPDKTESKDDIEIRLSRHLRALRVRKAEVQADDPISDTPEEDRNDGWRSPTDLGEDDRRRIRCRATALVARREAATGLGHLRKEEREQLSVLRDGVRLVTIPSEHRADELAAELHAEMPWMAPATEAVWHAMRASVRSGTPGFRLPPLLLDGPPGIGKSTWAQRLASLIGTATTQIDAASEAAGFAVAGCQRGWSSAAPGRPLELILRQLVANPIIVVDEIEKPGRVTSDKGRAHDLTDALLGLMEPVTARGWTCPYFRVRFDMGWIGWVMTSNNWRQLSPPFLSRCQLIRLGPLTSNNLLGFVEREAERRGIDGASVEAIAGALSRVDTQPDLRSLNRLLDRIFSLQNRPPIH